MIPSQGNRRFYKKMKLKFGLSLENNSHFPPFTVVLGKEKYFLEGIAKGIRSRCLIKVMHIDMIIHLGYVSNSIYSSHNFNIVKVRFMERNK